MACYRHFTLAKDSSPGFGSTARNYTHPLRGGYPPHSDSLSLRLLCRGDTAGDRPALRVRRDPARHGEHRRRVGGERRGRRRSGGGHGRSGDVRGQAGGEGPGDAGDAVKRPLLALLVLASPAGAQTPLRAYSDAFVQRYDRTAPKVDYTVTVRDDDRSAYFVELRIANAPNPARVVIPEWAPGAYRTLQSARNIAAIAAFTEAGKPLPVTADSGNGWSVDTRGAATIVVRYAAADRRPPPDGYWTRANSRWYLRPTAGLIDGPRTFMYLDGWKLTPSHITFRLPAGWRIGTGLVPTTDSLVYWAPSYDVLIDSPVLVGHFVTHRFTAGGVPHRAVVDLNGATAAYDGAAFTDMLRRVAETTIGMFGSAPYKDFTFIFTGIGGGLEHLNSTTIG